MGTLYVDHRDSRLRREGRSLVVYEDDHRRTSVPAALLERVVLVGTVALDSGVLGFLGDQGVAVMVLGGRRRDRLAVVTGRAHNEVTRRRAQYRLFDDAGWRREWARRVVGHKLAAQERLLRRGLRRRSDQRLALGRGIAQLAGLRARLLGSTEPPGLDQVRGMEGAGAAAYFGAFAALFPESLAFQGRNRRPPRDPVNAVLSLGYTMLHGDAVQACHGAGLDPLLGYFHDLDYGRESLAADLVEPFRPVVDGLAWRLFRDRHLRAEHFTHGDGACLLDKAGRAEFYPAYELAVRPARRALRRVAMKVALALPAVAASRLQGLAP